MPNLCAKDIIDIQVTVADFDAFCACKKLRLLSRLAMNGEEKQTLLPKLMGRLALYRLAK